MCPLLAEKQEASGYVSKWGTQSDTGLAASCSHLKLQFFSRRLNFQRNPYVDQDNDDDHHHLLKRTSVFGQILMHPTLIKPLCWNV